MLRNIPELMLAVLMTVMSAITAQAASLGSSQTPVVVELFTSQGCSSCPPADAFLGELAGEGNLLALAYHVDYWDYIGWKDPFASPEFTERQRDYKRSLGTRVVYTPQMVVDGRIDAVGSHRAAVRSAISQSAAHPKIPIAIHSLESGELLARIAATDVGLADSAVVWLVRFDGKHETAVKRGENSGTILTDYNVVRDMRQLGEWTGEAIDLPLGFRKDELGAGGCAVIVQDGPTGPVIGAAVIPANPEGGS